MSRCHGIFFTYDPGDNSRVGCQWLVSQEVFDSLREELAERLGPPSVEHFTPADVLGQIEAIAGRRSVSL